MPSPVSRRLLRRGLIAAAVVLVVRGCRGGVRAAARPRQRLTPQPRIHRADDDDRAGPAAAARSTSWSTTSSGPGTALTAAGPGSSPLRTSCGPPLHVGWRFNDGALLEFPPVIYHETLFLIDDNGVAKAINILNGHIIWHHQVGTLAAASPAVAANANLVLMPVLSTHGQPPGAGRVVALSMKNGHRSSGHGLAGRQRVLADRPRPHRLLRRSGRDPVGAQRPTGHVDWTYHASGAIKGGPALVNGVLYFGDYAGPRLRGQRGHRPPGLGGRHQRSPLRFRLGPVLRHARPWPSGASTWATPTAACTRSAPATAPWPGPPPPAPTSTPRPRWPTPRARPDGLRRLL